MKINVLSINIGMPQEMPFQNKRIQTGINKNPVSGPVFVSHLHMEGDGQADLTVHGGVDKAVCVYCFDHYPYWEETLGQKLSAGAFGENLTISGATEEEIMIGDIYQMGEVVFQVSLPRQPCYKLSVKWDEPSLPVMIKETGYSGFYFRVLQEGVIKPGETLRLVKRHQDAISIAFANHIKYKDKQNEEGLLKLVQLNELAEAWKNGFQNRLEEMKKSDKMP
ncbi:MOSC domain-containing protein [Priestia abyssalis]|uniref:MOSC domain-containing protein n=1 Tax=Priestia abyssalis TaxID=1221450 RepID=UPI000994E837|nr:MOSC domain-containing protein [Priestia abyssalis]